MGHFFNLGGTLLSTWSRLGLDLCGRPGESRAHPRLRHLDQDVSHPVFTTQVANAPDTGTDLLDRLHPVQNAEQKRIAWNALETKSTLSAFSISTAMGGSAERAIDWISDFRRL